MHFHIFCLEDATIRGTLMIYGIIHGIIQETIHVTLMIHGTIHGTLVINGVIRGTIQDLGR